MQCIPLPTKVIKNDEVICSLFLWSGGEKITRKSLVAWDKASIPKNQWGLNIISLLTWSKANLMKMLWNLWRKSYSLWIKWIHCYYVKNEDVMTIPIRNSCSWILKSILMMRQEVGQLQNWNNILQLQKFKTKKAYYDLKAQ